MANAHAIFAAKCSGCHTGGSAGGHNIGLADVDAAYTQSQQNADSALCTNLSNGACALVRIQNGNMPQGRDCSGNPVMDADKPACLTQAEQDTLAAWIAGGQVKE